MMSLPWHDGQFWTVTAWAAGALGWLLWPALRGLVGKPAPPGASPCARCAAGTAASCARHRSAGDADAAGEAAGGVLVQIGRR